MAGDAGGHRTFRQVLLGFAHAPVEGAGVGRTLEGQAALLVVHPPVVEGGRGPGVDQVLPHKALQDHLPIKTRGLLGCCWPRKVLQFTCIHFQKATEGTLNAQHCLSSLCIYAPRRQRTSDLGSSKASLPSEQRETPLDHGKCVSSQGRLDGATHEK